MKTVRATRSIDFDNLGGAELFFGDINGDGQLEIIAYQGPGVFGARLYANAPDRAPFMPGPECVSAFDMQGDLLWSWGKPNPAERPWVSHAFESCISLGDIDGDGRVEVCLALGSAVVVLDGESGREKRSASLPEDYFYIVHALGKPVAVGEAALVLKNGEGGYDGGVYGQPVIGLTADLELAWGPLEIEGAGHHLRTIPSARDGKPVYLVGYCAVRPDGTREWIADVLEGKPFDNAEMHVDYIDEWRAPDGGLLLAMAGSDRGYLIENGGRTLWTVEEGHMQGVAVGRFGHEGREQVCFYCAPDGPLLFCNMRGEKLARQAAPRLDEDGRPLVFADGIQRRFHRNRPIVAARGSEKDWIVFADGGWPWATDGSGGIIGFEPPDVAQRIDWRNPPVGNELRMDDLGYSYAVQKLPGDNGAPDMVMIYNRRNLWTYRLP